MAYRLDACNRHSRRLVLARSLALGLAVHVIKADVGRSLTLRALVGEVRILQIRVFKDKRLVLKLDTLHTRWIHSAIGVRGQFQVLYDKGAASNGNGNILVVLKSFLQALYRLLQVLV